MDHEEALDTAAASYNGTDRTMTKIFSPRRTEKISSTMQLFAKYACAMLINDVVSIWKLASNVHLISKLIQRGYRMFAFEERGPVDVSFFVDKRTSWLQYRAHIF